MWGCTVLSADRCSRVLIALDEHLRHPDLIVTDLRLAEATSGLDCITALRAFAEIPVPAIIVTGEVSVPEGLRLVDSVTVLQKPVGAERLKEACEGLLQQTVPSCATTDLPASETKT